MKQLYVIIASGGSYEDSWSQANLVTDDEVKGQAYVDEMNAYTPILTQKKADINKWRTDWQHNNPPPQCRSPVVIQEPKWGSNVTVTKEMRDERKRIQDANYKEVSDAGQPYTDWMRSSHNAWVEWQKATYSAKELEDLQFFDESIYWELEPIGWLE